MSDTAIKTKRYLIGYHMRSFDNFVLVGDVRGDDAAGAVLAWQAGEKPHRTFEAREFPDDGDVMAILDVAVESGYSLVRTAHEVSDDLAVPRPGEHLDGGDDVLRAATPIVFVGLRETKDSIWANRVKVSEESLEALVRNAYSLSSPQGLGFLNHQSGELDEETVQTILADADTFVYERLSMDYVHGRAVKFHVAKEVTGELYIEADRENPWLDHSHYAFAELLERSLSETDKKRNAPYLAAMKDYVEGRA